MANVAKLEATMDYLVCHPEEHDQEVWACGTRRCFAGTAAMLAGYEEFRSVGDHSLLGWYGTGGACVVPADDVLGFNCRGEFLASTQSLATRELDLTFEQVELLFFTSKTIDELQLAVKEIINDQQPVCV